MKSSTIRRSTLSRESIEVIENLSKEQPAENIIEEYVRADEYTAETGKSQEIDLLWQNFKSAQFNTNSPAAYILLGFCIGIIVSLIIGGIAGGYCLKSGKFPHALTKAVMNSQHIQTLEQQTINAGQELENKIIVPQDEEIIQPAEQTEVSKTEEMPVDTSKMKKYIVKDGDTGESIIKRYYGSYTPERAELIMKVNNMKSLDRINIDQELLIPVE